jgi:hypothetical protein
MALNLIFMTTVWKAMIASKEKMLSKHEEDPLSKGEVPWLGRYIYLNCMYRGRLDLLLEASHVATPHKS